MLRERVISAAFGAGWTLVCRLPESWARALFRAGADIAWRRQGHGVQVLEGNLLRVLRTDAADSGSAHVDGKELRSLSRKVLRSYARYYLETFRLQIIPEQRILDGMQANTANVDLTLEYLKNGRGVIYALPHMGDFEQAGRWVNLYGAGSFTTVAERLKPESVYERWLKFRQSLGREAGLPGGGPRPLRNRRRGGLLRRESAAPGRAGRAGGADRGGADARFLLVHRRHRVGHARI